MNHKLLSIKENISGEICNDCNFCLRMKLLEIGVRPGQQIKLQQVNKELWRVSILEDGKPITNLGLRKTEVDELLADDKCFLQIQ